MAKSKNIKEALSGHLLKDETLDAVRLGILSPNSVSEVYRYTKGKEAKSNAK